MSGWKLYRQWNKDHITMDKKVQCIRLCRRDMKNHNLKYIYIYLYDLLVYLSGMKTEIHYSGSKW